MQRLTCHGHHGFGAMTVKGHLTDNLSLPLSNPPHVGIRRSKEASKIVVGKVAGIAVEFVDRTAYLLTPV